MLNDNSVSYVSALSKGQSLPSQTAIVTTALALEKLHSSAVIEPTNSGGMFVFDKNGTKVTL